jgi:arylsulfatase A
VAEIFRGGKYSAYEAGTRVPTIVYWPGSVEASISHALMSQIDLYASLAAFIGQDIAERDAIDSRNYIDAWLGRTHRSRDYLLEESVGSMALRKGNWKYIPPYEGGGGVEWVADDKNIEGGFATGPQLYNLTGDPGEQANLADRYPALVAELHAESLRIFTDTYR